MNKKEFVKLSENLIKEHDKKYRIDVYLPSGNYYVHGVKRELIYL